MDTSKVFNLNENIVQDDSFSVECMHKNQSKHFIDILLCTRILNKPADARIY